MIWRDLAFAWILVHTFVLIGVLMEPRLPRARMAWALAAASVPVVCLDMALYLRLGLVSVALIVTAGVVPAFALLMALSRWRDARFVFTFFLCCSVSLLVADLAALAGYPAWLRDNSDYLPTFVASVVLYPLVEWVAVRHVRGPYLRLQRDLTHGWGTISLIGALSFALLLLSVHVPEGVGRRPAYFPHALVAIALTPLVYYALFSTVTREGRLHRTREREQLLELQAAMLRERLEQEAQAAESVAIARHDLRHHFQVVVGMAEHGETDELLAYVRAADSDLVEAAPRRWCLNPALNAVFSSYLGRAEAQGVRVRAELDVPRELDVDEADFACLVSNALENAVRAVGVLPRDQREVRVRLVREPQLIFEVANPVAGEVTFGDDGLPVSAERGHGLGMRSIAAYCEKHGAYCDCEVRGGWFVLQVVQPQAALRR